MKSAKATKNAPARKKILILEDHPITRQGLCQLFRRQPDLAVCGEAENVEQAAEAIKSLQPDVVLADLSLPGKNGLEFIRDLSVQHPAIKILVLSMHDEGVYAERSLRAGAHGYVMKTERSDKLLDAIRQVLLGEFYVSGRVSGNLLDGLSRRRQHQTAPSLGMLTTREFEIFQLIGQGLSTREITAKLSISGKTVETHRMHLKDKLNLKSGTELVSYAVRWVVTNQLV
ncbi:MAG: response regulator transcription factor [Verrucomicrobiota bacterium]